MSTIYAEHDGRPRIIVKPASQHVSNFPYGPGLMDQLLAIQRFPAQTTDESANVRGRGRKQLSQSMFDSVLAFLRASHPEFTYANCMPEFGNRSNRNWCLHSLFKKGLIEKIRSENGKRWLYRVKMM